jgi:CSLREA domain-containing protein
MRVSRAVVVASLLVSSVAARVALAVCPPSPTFQVTSTADVVDANLADCICDTGGGVCTLRAAIMQADATTGATILIPGSVAKYGLTILPSGGDDVQSGDLDITSDMSIVGAGASTTIIDGNQLDRVFDVYPGVTVSMSGITIQNGKTSDWGGAVLSGGVLTLTRCVLANNSASLGGAILSGVPSTGAYSLALDGVTLTGNHAAGSGGALHTNVDTTIVNSTISGNTANASGGGLSFYDSGGVTAALFNVTVTDNQADADFDGSGVGGGIAGGPVYFTNTILADNSETVFCGPPFCPGIYIPTPGDCSGAISSGGYSILANYDTSRCTVTGSFTLAEPLLAPLQMNGGPTPTHALPAGSPAVGGGDPSGCKGSLASPLVVDQRGAHRPEGAACDVGAYERDANGDVNGDGTRTVADVFYLINFLFAGGPAPLGLGDVNGDAKTDIADVFYLINFLFAGGPAPL